MTDLRKTLTLDKTQVAMIKAFGNQELTDYCIVQVAWFYIYYRDKSVLESKYKILWHEPHLFPDVAKNLKEEGYRIEVTIDWKILLFRDDQSDFITLEEEIPFDPCLPLLEQPEVMEQLLSLIK